LGTFWNCWSGIFYMLNAVPDATKRVKTVQEKTLKNTFLKVYSC